MTATNGTINIDSFNSLTDIEDINITSDESVFGLKSNLMVESILNENWRTQLIVGQRMDNIL